MNPTRERTESAGRDVWTYMLWYWYALTYVALLLPALVALRAFGWQGTAATRIVGLMAIFTVLHGALLLYVWRVEEPHKRPLWFLLYTVALLLIWLALVTIHPVFFFALIGIYGQIFVNLQLRYAIPAALLLTAMAGGVQVLENGGGLSLLNPFVWLYVLISVAGIALALWINAIISQSNQRRELIEQLEAAQAELATAERNAGILEERQRLAREIHDTLAQGFTSIVMHLEAADQALPQDVATVQRHLDQSRHIARASLEQARRVVQDLRPDLLEKEPLPQAIARVVDQWSQQSDVAATAATTGAIIALHPQVEVTLLRATQEALANVRKHAGATQVTVTLSYMGDVVVLDVQDNGRGTAASAAARAESAGGFGLAAMRERVEMLNGSLLVESAPGEGTTLVVELPVQG